MRCSWAAYLLVMLIGGFTLGACGATPPPPAIEDDTGTPSAAQAEAPPIPTTTSVATVAPPTATPLPTVPPSPTATPLPTVPPSPTPLAFLAAVRPPDPDHPAIVVDLDHPQSAMPDSPEHREQVRQAAAAWETMATCPLLRVDPVVEDELERLMTDIFAIEQSSADEQAALDAAYWRRIESIDRMVNHLGHPDAIATLVIGRFYPYSTDVLAIAQRFPDDPCRQLRAVVDEKLPPPPDTEPKPWQLTDPSHGIVLSLRIWPIGHAASWYGFGIGYIIPPIGGQP